MNNITIENTTFFSFQFKGKDILTHLWSHLVECDSKWNITKLKKLLFLNKEDKFKKNNPHKKLITKL